MALRALIATLGLIAAASPVAASQPEPTPAGAPAASPDARYCLRVGPYTGSRLEAVQCWTRQEWAEQCSVEEWPLDMQCVDVDKEWARNGVRIIG